MLRLLHGGQLWDKKKCYVFFASSSGFSGDLGNIRCLFSGLCKTLIFQNENGSIYVNENHSNSLVVRLMDLSILHTLKFATQFSNTYAHIQFLFYINGRRSCLSFSLSASSILFVFISSWFLSFININHPHNATFPWT